MRRSTRPLRRFAILAGMILSVPVQTLAQEPEVWVVAEKTKQIFVIDPRTDQILTAFDISDPDGDQIPDVPAGGLAFGTVPDVGGDFGFVSFQDGTLAVLDVSGRGVLHSYDLASLLSGSACHPASVSGVTLRGIEASVPRSFPALLGRVTRSYLFVAATTSAGEALAVVLDQNRLIGGAVAPLVDCVTLATNATALDVEVLESPHGDEYLRAWFAVRGNAPANLQAVRVFLPDAFIPSLVLAERQVTTLPSSLPRPDLLKPLGAPFGRELPVWSLRGGAALGNMDTGGECALGFAPTKVAVTGVGPNSYEVWALDANTGQLVEVDPTSCDLCPSSVGMQPVDVAFLGSIRFRSAFTADYLSDTITRVNKDGSVKTIALGPSPIGSCIFCPMAIGIARPPLCEVRITAVQHVDTDGNDLADTVHLEWEGIGCGDGREYEVACACMTPDADCPCRCQCPDPTGECDCPGICLAPAAPEALGLGIQVPPWDPDPTSNPWRPLGTTEDECFDQPIPEGNESGVAYGVMPVE